MDGSRGSSLIQPYYDVPKLAGLVRFKSLFSSNVFLGPKRSWISEVPLYNVMYASFPIPLGIVR